MEVLVEEQQTDLPLDLSRVAPLVAKVLEEEGTVVDEVSVRFVGLDEICELHDRFFGDPSPTDCISFPIDEEEDGDFRLLGEVVVCPRAALLYTGDEGGEPYEECSLYIVHGLLHLLGYDDSSEKDLLEMREREAQIMGRLRAEELLLQPPPPPPIGHCDHEGSDSIHPGGGSKRSC